MGTGVLTMTLVLEMMVGKVVGLYYKDLGEGSCGCEEDGESRVTTIVREMMILVTMKMMMMVTMMMVVMLIMPMTTVMMMVMTMTMRMTSSCWYGNYVNAQLVEPKK